MSPFCHAHGSQFPGTCMFVSSTLAPTRNGLCEKAEVIPVVLNTCCCFIHFKSQTFAVLSLYRSPSTSVHSALEDLEATLHTLLPHAYQNLSMYNVKRIHSSA